MSPSPLSAQPQEDRASPLRVAPQAEKALFRAVMAYVCNTLCNLSVPRADRDDLAQKIVIAAYMNRERYDPERGAPYLWVRGFVINFVRNFRHERYRAKEILAGSLPEIVDETPGVEDQYVAEMQRRLLQEILLPQVDFEARVVVVGHDLEGLDFKVIAAQQEIPLSTAHDRYKRGIKQLEAACARHERRQRAQGLVVLPIALGPLLAASRAIPPAPVELVQLAWGRVQRALLWQARWNAFRALLRRKSTAAGAAFLAGAVMGAVLLALLQAPSPPAPVVVVQSSPAELAPGVASGAAEPSTPPTAAVAPLATPTTSSAPRHDRAEAQRLFDAAHQSIDRGNLDAALQTLATLDRYFPTGILVTERQGMRARIAELRAARGPKAKP